jgi:hypothetical protein
MSASLLKADIGAGLWHVRFVPNSRSRGYSIPSSARALTKVTPVTFPLARPSGSLPMPNMTGMAEVAAFERLSIYGLI